MKTTEERDDKFEEFWEDNKPTEGAYDEQQLVGLKSMSHLAFISGATEAFNWVTKELKI